MTIHVLAVVLLLFLWGTASLRVQIRTNLQIDSRLYSDSGRVQASETPFGPTGVLLRGVSIAQRNALGSFVDLTIRDRKVPIVMLSELDLDLPLKVRDVIFFGLSTNTNTPSVLRRVSCFQMCSQKKRR